MFMKKNITVNKVTEWLIENMPKRSDRYTPTEMGAGNLFADVFESIARYVPEQGSWLVYGGKRWTKDDENLRVQTMCKVLSQGVKRYANTLQDGPEKEVYVAYAKKWESKRFRDTVIKDAVTEWTTSIEEFDADPYLLNCQNGTLNLKTGEFTDHNNKDMLTRISDRALDYTQFGIRFLIPRQYQLIMHIFLSRRTVGESYDEAFFRPACCRPEGPGHDPGEISRACGCLAPRNLPLGKWTNHS